jgi:hypothetical protein
MTKIESDYSNIKAGVGKECAARILAFEGMTVIEVRGHGTRKRATPRFIRVVSTRLT